MARGRHDYEKKVIAVESEGYKDLHGRILMQDDFEDSPLKWDTFVSGTGVMARTTRAAYNGSFGLEFDFASNAPPAERYAVAQRVIPIGITQRISLELFWQYNRTDWINEASFAMHFYTGTHLIIAEVESDPLADEWRYRNAAGGFTPMPDMVQSLQGLAWNEMTLVADFATGEYILLRSNNMEANMGRIPCWVTPSPWGARLEVFIEARNTTANHVLMYVDDVVAKEVEV